MLPDSFQLAFLHSQRWRCSQPQLVCMYITSVIAIAIRRTPGKRNQWTSVAEHRDAKPLALGDLLLHYSLAAKHLHNAGNGAYYTLRVIIVIATDNFQDKEIEIFTNPDIQRALEGRYQKDQSVPYLSGELSCRSCRESYGVQYMQPHILSGLYR